MTIEEVFAAATAESRADRLDRAEALYRQVLAERPGHVEAHFNLGNLLARVGRIDEAIAAFRQAVTLRPQLAQGWRNLGAALIERDQIDPAIEALGRALELRPDDAETRARLGSALLASEHWKEAIANCQRAAAVKSTPSIAPQEREQLEAAVALFRRVTELRPDAAEAWCALGVALGILLRPEEAETAFRQVVKLRADNADDWNNLATTLEANGSAEEAAKCYGRSLSIRPDRFTHSQRLVLLWLCADQDAQSLLREHRDWNDHYARPLAASIRPHDNDRNPDHRLRVGYLSPHLCKTTTAWNLLPLLKQHDRKQFEIFCYSATPRRDETTERLIASTDGWRDILNLGDDEAAELIRKDQIDILVDLSLHLLGNRLLVFARKPAPVQVTYLGYCATTGLDAIDYRLSDPYFDPPGSDLSVYSERTALLPHAYWAYEPGGPMPSVSPPPALTAGYVTFASLNHFYKASPPARQLWARVLLAAPGSRFLIHAPPGSQRARVQEEFAAAGVAPDRLEFMPTQPWPQYVDAFRRIDIALDSFPHAGGIANCDCLMMGVPLVTLRGSTSVGRGGCSALSNVGLPELIAETPDDYVRIAAELAADLPRLASLRAGLRQRMEQSPLRDHESFTRGVEAAYRRMWRTWCESSR